MQPTADDNGQAYGPLSDAPHVAKVAASYLPGLEERSRRAGPLTARRRVTHVAGRVRQWIPRKFKELIHDHWDVGLFDVTFGSLKAFLIYPWLYFSGLTWTIPIMEYLPLNTQLWTAGYLFCRGQILSGIGRLRYGHSLNSMNAYRDGVLKIHPRDARSIHRFRWGAAEYTVRLGRNPLRSWLGKVFGRRREPNVVLQSELRGMISDREFIYQANPLRGNTYLYEEVLLARILATEEDRPKLLRVLVPGPAAQVDPVWLNALGETDIPTYARVFEQGDSLTAALKRTLGRDLSATSLALRWLNWAYQRQVYRGLAELNALRYRLIAAALSKSPAEESKQVGLIREKRAEIDAWLRRGVDFGEQAKSIASRAEGRELIRREIALARSVGLTVRLASCAYWVSARRAAFASTG